MRINNSNVKDHFLTECQFSDDEGLGGFKRATLTGFVEGRAYPFLTSIEAFKFARSIPKQTWGEALKEKLPEEVYEIVAGYTGEERLDKAFTRWSDWFLGGNSFRWTETKEGHDYFQEVYLFLKDEMAECPLPPKPELRIMTAIELAGKYLIKGDTWHLLAQSYEDIEDRHKNGWKWCNHPSEEQFSLMVEV